MIETAGFLSVVFYAAGAGMLFAAAVVFKKNRLIEYYRITKNQSGKTAPHKRDAGRKDVKQPVAGRKKKVKAKKADEKATVKLSAAVESEEDATNVRDGSAGTTLLNETELVTKAHGMPERIWGKPSKKFRVVASDMVTSDQPGKRGE